MSNIVIALHVSSGFSHGFSSWQNIFLLIWKPHLSLVWQQSYCRLCYTISCDRKLILWRFFNTTFSVPNSISLTLWVYYTKIRPLLKFISWDVHIPTYCLHLFLKTMKNRKLLHLTNCQCLIVSFERLTVHFEYSSQFQKFNFKIILK